MVSTELLSYRGVIRWREAGLVVNDLTGVIAPTAKTYGRWLYVPALITIKNLNVFLLALWPEYQPDQVSNKAEQPRWQHQHRQCTQKYRNENFFSDAHINPFRPTHRRSI